MQRLRQCLATLANHLSEIRTDIRDFTAPLPDPLVGRRTSLFAPELWERMHWDDVKYAVREASREYRREWASTLSWLVGSSPPASTPKLNAESSNDTVQRAVSQTQEPRVVPQITGMDIRDIVTAYGTYRCCTRCTHEHPNSTRLHLVHNV